MPDAADAQPPGWYVWLSVPIDWREFQVPAPPGQHRPQAHDLLLYGAPCALLLLLLRAFIEFCVMRPLGHRLGLSDKRVVVSSAFRSKSASLEPEFRRDRRPDAARVRDLSRRLGFTEKSIANWFRQRRNKDKPSQLARFGECGWYTVYYCTFLAYGLAVQWSEAYFWDSEELWVGWPRHYVQRSLFWYFMLQLGFYCSSLLTLCFDVKRKDFLEMALHHVVTLVMIVLAWSLNFTRVGAFTLVLHDAVDPLLSFGKLAQYARATLVSDATFCVFLVVWVLTRLVALPVRIVYSVYADSLRILRVPPCPPYYIFLAAFATLQVLHCVWTYYIFRIVLLILRHGQNAGDIRSDSEISDGDEAKED